MGVFLGGPSEDCGQAILKSAERCHPDFEAIISRLRDREKVSKDLMSAVEDYLKVEGGGRDTFTLPSLVGSLYLEIKQFERRIAEAITEQEKLTKDGKR